MPSLLIATLIFAAFYVAMGRGLIARHWAALIAGGVLLGIGTVAGFYSPAMAVDAVFGETLALIFGMSIISATLLRSGLFHSMTRSVVRHADGNGRLIVLSFILLTYLLSLTVNNLATMVILLPMALTVCRTAGMNPVPMTVAMVVASNIGGASTMVGDFPNMIIASAAKLSFVDFLGGMMAPCLILLAASLVYFERAGGRFHAHQTTPGERRAMAARLDDDDDYQPVDVHLVNVGLGGLALALIGFVLSGYSDLNPGVVAVAVGVGALLLGQWEPSAIYDACGGKDILFFLGLFVLVGGIGAAGGMEWLADLIFSMGQGKGAYELVALMWIAGGATVLLNAGPSTAFFIPVASEMSYHLPGEAVWWALSLGVLAGSSATITGATAGSLAVTQMEQRFRDEPAFARLVPEGKPLDFKEYLSWGAPLMLLFLVLSTPYILLIAPN